MLVEGVGVLKTREPKPPPIARSIAVFLVVVMLGACSHSTDTGMIEAAESLVPPESEILEVTDNSKGLTIVNGDYWAALQISDGGLGPALLDAVQEQAKAEGWQERYRCDVPAGVTLGYVRDDYQVDVGVRTKKEAVDAYIHIRRLGDGNPWPPVC